MTRKKVRQALTRQVRMQARFLAEDLMAELKPHREIVLVVAERFGCTEQAARRVVQDAWQGLATAEAEDRAERRGQMELAMQKLYRDAHRARQYGVCARIAKDLKDLFGLDAPIKVEGLVPVHTQSEEDRPDADLEFYDKHGYWPEEAPRQRKVAAAPDPLARLH